MQKIVTHLWFDHQAEEGGGNEMGKRRGTYWELSRKAIATEFSTAAASGTPLETFDVRRVCKRRDAVRGSVGSNLRSSPRQGSTTPPT